MWDLASRTLDTSRLRLAALSLLAVTFLFPGVAGREAMKAAQSDPAVRCGKVDEPFHLNPCRQLSFGGEISAGQPFVRRFSGHLLFRLNPERALDGWVIEVAPEQAGAAGQDEYSWVATPPYHLWNPRYLDTSYGVSAKESVERSPREFNFVLNEQEYKRTADLVEKAVMSRPQSDNRSEAEIEKESQDAAEALLNLPVAKGWLSILDSRIETADKSGGGRIEWLKFKVDLRVPCDFAVLTDSPGMLVDDSQCPAAKEHRVN